MQVVEVKSERDGVEWDRYVQEHPKTCGYHLRGWRQVVEEACGHRTYYFMAKNEWDRVTGVLPLVFLSSRLFGRFLVSMPFVNYGGLVGDSAQAREALLREAVDLGRRLDCKYIELRHQEGVELDWPGKQHKVSMRLELPAHFGELWQNFVPKLRSQIRRAQAEGMTVRVGGDEQLGDFYEVFSRNMRDLGTPVYGKGFFQAVLRAFPKDSRICTVHWRGRPLAAGFLYGFRRMLEIPWASSDRRYNRLAANMLLYNSVLEYACLEGFQVFDFGRSTIGSGPHRFKEQWGARPVPLRWQYWLGGEEHLPELSPRNPSYGLAIKVWQRLPVTVTRWLGPWIVKNIP